jgi:hypothetical protein
MEISFNIKNTRGKAHIPAEIGTSSISSAHEPRAIQSQSCVLDTYICHHRPVVEDAPARPLRQIVTLPDTKMVPSQNP